MGQGNGLITKILSWGIHPTYSEGTVLDWAAGLVLVVLVSLMWAQVNHMIE